MYMVLGLSALLLTALLTFSSFQRARRVAYSSTRLFRITHNWQTIIVVALSALHIALSGYYFVFYWQWVCLLIALSFILPIKTTTAKKTERRQSLREVSTLLTLCAAVTFMFTLVRWMEWLVNSFTTAITLFIAIVTAFMLWAAYDVECFASPKNILPMTFAHADHGGENCLICHHNFQDDTGGGACIICHQTDPSVNLIIREQFHDLCMNPSIIDSIQGGMWRSM